MTTGHRLMKKRQFLDKLHFEAGNSQMVLAKKSIGLGVAASRMVGRMSAGKS